MCTNADIVVTTGRIKSGNFTFVTKFGCEKIATGALPKISDIKLKMHNPTNTLIPYIQSEPIDELCIAADVLS